MARVHIESSFIPPDNEITSDHTTFNGKPPAGFQYVKSAPPEASTIAKKLLNTDFGTLTPFTIDGKEYLARTENHYHEPGTVGAGVPTGWHKGVSIFSRKELGDESSNSQVDIKTNNKFLDKLDQFLSTLI